MNTSMSTTAPLTATTTDIEIVESGDTPGELWVIVPALPVRDWPTTRATLPYELQTMQLVDHHAFRADGECFDGWILQ